MRNSSIKLRERIISILLIAVMLLPTLLNTITIAADGFVVYEGSGTEEDPYQITTIEQLRNLANESNTIYYKLMNDLDMSSVTDFTPMGTATSPFKGILDGNGHKISNLKIESTAQDVGLFGYINGGTIKNLELNNVTVTGGEGSINVGGLAGRIDATKIENVRITGDSKIYHVGTNSDVNIGGLIGYFLKSGYEGSPFRNNSVEGKIQKTTGDGNIGGLIGYSSTGGNTTEIGQSYSNVEISGSGNIGGLIGKVIFEGTDSGADIHNYIDRSFSKGSISGSGNIGGLIGTAQGHVYHYTNAFGQARGVLQYVYVRNCYSDVNITGTGTGNFGGVVGTGVGIECAVYIKASYSIGTIKAEEGSKGGIIIATSARVEDSYWAQRTGGLSASDSTSYGTATSMQSLLNQNTYSGWDFDDTWAIETNNGSFAFLKWEEHLTINKKIAESITPLKDAKIGIYDNYDNLLKNISGKDKAGLTDAKGEVIFKTDDLTPGTYYYKEIEAPTGYAVNPEKYYFQIGEQGKITFNEGVDGTIYNSPTSSVGVTSVEITKYETGTTNPVAGAIIALCTETGSILKDKEGTNDAVITTGADGKINFATIYNFAPGTYYYKEAKAPEGYIQYTGIDSFTIDESGNITFNNGTNGIIYNQKEITTIPAGSEGATLTKQDESTKAPLAGAQIGLYDEAKTSLSIVLTTNASGQVDLSEKGNLEKGKTYYYKEEVAPTGYIQDTNFHKFTVTTDGKVVIEDGNILTNKKRTAGSNQGIVTKYKSVKGVGTIVVVSGAKIGLYEADGTTKIAELTTDDKGQVSLGSTGKLEAGKTYKYKEEAAPDGYILNNTVYEIEVKADGTVEFKQEPKGIIYNEERLFLNSSVYEIDTKYMTRIKPRTTVAQLKANCTTNGDIEIYKDGKKLEDSDIVGTGMILRDTKLDEKIELKLSVIGDLNGDGKVTLTDIARSELAYIGNIDLQEEYLLSADINNDKKHTLTDISRLEQYLVGLIEI